MCHNNNNVFSKHEQFSIEIILIAWGQFTNILNDASYLYLLFLCVCTYWYPCPPVIHTNCTCISDHSALTLTHFISCVISYHVKEYQDDDRNCRYRTYLASRRDCFLLRLYAFELRAVSSVVSLLVQATTSALN